MALEFWTLTGNLTAIVVDYTDVGSDPDLQHVACTVDFIPRIPAGEILWASGLTPKQGLALATFRARFDTDGYLRTIAAGGAQDETQTVTITGSPTGGTFTLTWQGQTTTAIARNATSLTVQNALAALSNIGVGNVSVGGATGGPWTVAFIGTFAATDVPQLTATPSFTGGTLPNIVIATTHPGSLNAGVKLLANTVALNLDELIYDVVFSNVVYNRQDHDISPRAFLAPTVGGGTLDMADLVWIPPKPDWP